MWNASFYQMVPFLLMEKSSLALPSFLQCIHALRNGMSPFVRENVLNLIQQREASASFCCLVEVCRALFTDSFLSLKQSNYIQISLHVVVLSSNEQ